MWKIGDFGLTTDGTSKKKWTTRYVRGTNCYRAPELIRDEKYTNKVDIFAFGCVLYEATFLEKAFSDDFWVVQYATTGSGVVYPTQPQSARDERSIEEATTIIKKALEVDPKRRPRAQELHQTLLDRKILCHETVDILAQKFALTSRCHQEEVPFWNNQILLLRDQSSGKRQRQSVQAVSLSQVWSRRLQRRRSSSDVAFPDQSPVGSKTKDKLFQDR